MNAKTKRLTTGAMLAAIAYAVMAVCRIPLMPAAEFLNYDPKDVIIVIGGFIYGPAMSFMISAVVSLIEMVTVSDTGIIGCVMNILSTCSFACTAAFIYKKMHSAKGAVVGLVVGVLLMTIVMILWNYILTPIYRGWPRDMVAEMLLPIFMPFNLLKGFINASLTMLLYKPIVTALRKSHLLESGTDHTRVKRRSVGMLLVGGVILVTCVLVILAMRGIL